MCLSNAVREIIVPGCSAINATQVNRTQRREEGSEVEENESQLIAIGIRINLRPLLQKGGLSFLYLLRFHSRNLSPLVELILSRLGQPGTGGLIRRIGA